MGELLFGSPQGFILGPLLVIIFLCDFEEYIHIASYADGNTPYSVDSNIENTISSLEFSFAR